MSLPYATTDDFANCFDIRALNELCSDTDADGDYDGNSLLEELLTQASYDIQSFVLRGGVYTSADLDDLQTAEDKTLVRLTCVLAAQMLATRRMGSLPDSLSKEVDKAYVTLGDLRDGRRVFGDMAADKSSANNPAASFVSASQRPLLRMVADSEFFPARITSGA